MAETGILPMESNTNTNLISRVREIRVPRWDGINSAQSWKNYKHLIFTNMHCSASIESDAEKLIELIEDQTKSDSDLRNNLSQTQCALDAELYRGITNALSGGKTDSIIALTKIRESAKIGRGMHALRILERELMLETGRSRTEGFSKMIKLTLSHHASIDACRIYLSELETAKVAGGIDDDIRLECLKTQIHGVKLLEAPFSAWQVGSNQSYKSLIDVIDRF